jgi:hypothetical protein
MKKIPNEEGRHLEKRRWGVAARVEGMAAVKLENGGGWLQHLGREKRENGGGWRPKEKGGGGVAAHKGA